MISVLPDAVLESVAKTVGNATSGSEISRIFMSCNMVDTSGESTKWRRIYHTFQGRQREDRCANNVMAFAETVMSPARWTDRREEHGQFREQLNQALLLAGLQMGADGKVRAVTAASTLDESAERANMLRSRLQQRSVHFEVLRFSQRLLIHDGNYFHAVFEATKSVMDRLRTMTNSLSDGNMLIDEPLECGKRFFPLVALNRYDTSSLQNDQKGIAHLARGLVYAFRNVTAHEPQIEWRIPEEDALDMMSVASLIHRRLDNAIVTSAYQSG